MFEKIPRLLSGDENIGESNTSNKLKALLGASIWTVRSCVMKKETKKSRDTVPLNIKLKTDNPLCKPEASSKMSTISEQGA